MRSEYGVKAEELIISFKMRILRVKKIDTKERDKKNYFKTLYCKHSYLRTTHDLQIDI